MTADQKNNEPREIDFGKAYDGILDMQLAGFSSLVLTMPSKESVPAFTERRSGSDRRFGGRRSSDR